MANEFIDQVKADTSAYLKTQSIVSRLRIIGGVSRLLGLFLMLLTVVLLGFGLLAFLGVAAVIGLAYCMPHWAAALIIGGVYVIFIILAVTFRKQLFINPFVAMMSKILFAEEGRQAEEERLREEAIHD